MKLRLQANKLEDPKVSHISLVDHAANRIPFRMLKRNQEQGMINLDRIFKQAKPVAKTATPKVLGIVVEKSDKVEAIKKAVTEAGFVVKGEQASGNVVILKADEADIDMAQVDVVKVSNDTLALIAKADTAALHEASGPFAEGIKANGFLPSVSTAMMEAHAQLLEAVDAGEDVVQKAEVILDGYKAYALKALELLPAMVYKADVAVYEAKKAECDPKPKMDDDKSKEGEGEGAAEPAAPAADPAAAPVEPKPADPPVDPAVAVAEAVAKALSPLADQIKNISTGLADLQGQFSSVAKAQEDLNAKVEKAESVAKAAKDAVKGTVPMSPPPGDVDPQPAVTQKADSPYTGVFDTAFMPRRATKRAR